MRTTVYCGRTSVIYLVYAWAALCIQKTQNIFITFVQRWQNVFDVGPTVYKCYTNVLCLLGKTP